MEVGSTREVPRRGFLVGAQVSLTSLFLLTGRWVQVPSKPQRRLGVSRTDGISPRHYLSFQWPLVLHVLCVWIIQCFSHPLMLALFSQMIRLNRVEITGCGSQWVFSRSHHFHLCCKVSQRWLFFPFVSWDFFPLHFIYHAFSLLACFIFASFLLSVELIGDSFFPQWLFFFFRKVVAYV